MTGLPRMSGGGEANFMGLPRGSRDLLPPAGRRRRWLTSKLVRTFERWGYDPVVTPLVEYFDVLALGLTPADQRACVRFIEAASGEVVTLRSDPTPQIARMVAHRLGGALTDGGIQRLCYAADVVRQPSVDTEQTEYHQVGVELMGDADPAADVELLALCDRVFVDVGLPDFRIDLSHRGVASSILDRLGLSDDARGQLVASLARKDPQGIESLLASNGVAEADRRAVTGLCDLVGAPEILDRAKGPLTKAGAGPGVERLQAVLEALEVQAPGAHRRVCLDLGEVRGFDYYTGLRLRVWAEGVSRPIVRGGRYDGLVGRYGAGRPATGFAIDLDALESALFHARVNVGGSATAATVVAVTSRCCSPAGRALAATKAQEARDAGRRAWVVPGLTQDSALAVASEAGADHVVLVDGGDAGQPAAESFFRREDGWQPSGSPSDRGKEQTR